MRRRPTVGEGLREGDLDPYHTGPLPPRPHERTREEIARGIMESRRTPPDRRGGEQKEEYDARLADKGIRKFSVDELFDRPLAPKEKDAIETRLRNLQRPEVLAAKNKDGESAEKVINELLQAMSDFYHDHEAELRQCDSGSHQHDAEGRMCWKMRQLLSWYPDIYFHGSDLVFENVDKILAFYRDGFWKVFGEPLSHISNDMRPRGVMKEDRRRQLGSDIDVFLRKMSELLETLPWTKDDTVRPEAA